MKEKKEKKNSAEESKEQDFKGYSMDELRYQRALVALKKEFLKEKALKQTETIKEQLPLINGKMPSGKISGSGVMGKILKGLSFADYLLLGFQGVRIVKKIGTIFKRK